MPELDPSQFNLEALSPSEMEQRRRNLVDTLRTQYKSYSDPDIPIELLHELTAITTRLRARTAGPPRTARVAGAKAAKPKATLTDIAALMGATK